MTREEARLEFEKLMEEILADHEKAIILTEMDRKDEALALLQNNDCYDRLDALANYIEGHGSNLEFLH